MTRSQSALVAAPPGQVTTSLCAASRRTLLNLSDGQRSLETDRDEYRVSKYYRFSIAESA